MEDLEHGWLVSDRSDDEEEELYTCEWCGEPIYYGDIYYDLCGEKVCEACVDECRKTADD